MNRSIIATVGILLLAASAAVADRPNVLFIMADDLGKEWLSCYGSQTHRTPNIDRLAAQGLQFENVYATPLCTPTRHILMTGRYPFRTGWTVHHDAPRWGGQYFDWKREVAFPRLLRDAGYATAIAGKWQINDLRVTPDALHHHGFDEHCVWPGFETGNPDSDHRYFDPYVQENGRRERRMGQFGPDIFADFIIDFMTRHKDGPFFAYYAMVLPHGPNTKTPLNPDTKAVEAELYPGMVDYVDHLVGRLVGAVDGLGIRRNTLVIFTTDNGSPGTTARMRGLEVEGGKTLMTEAGICVPFIVRWPGYGPKNEITPALVDFSDIFPTLVELAGARLPQGLTIDGRSLAPILCAKPGARSQREWMYSQLGQHRVVRDERYKLHEDGRFYDLVNDPLESRDLAGDDDPRLASTRERLAEVLASFPPDARLPFEPRRTAAKPE